MCSSTSVLPGTCVWLVPDVKHVCSRCRGWIPWLLTLAEGCWVGSGHHRQQGLACALLFDQGVGEPPAVHIKRNILCGICVWSSWGRAQRFHFLILSQTATQCCSASPHSPRSYSDPLIVWDSESPRWHTTQGAACVKQWAEGEEYQYLNLHHRCHFQRQNCFNSLFLLFQTTLLAVQERTHWWFWIIIASHITTEI